ncbi:3-dehydroquinate synthase [Pseudomonas protegens]|uniref:3-dehydroquinate synthase AroB n=1 Tax=Pseudomonas protegens (strain DSM 19095 / LMG 27888 / CFBP 6595 / CHA0) TaxID=1124983 RepID=A0A2C9EU79_PSEPH|nr:3-dehydroquinate synthase [Pseudomonas protegens]AGL87230.1 3-dehydroquinate synthase AroB [Pseudomonas protegens CHA0]MBP5113474.1 3-dehydroquinate synthase [Pseudomonas protegens]QTU27351.1 3-dehydroquinate synthase [Pseudomonas protegens]QTU30987.1 3-dehydroquinate synthase [Pseudomonas protegens]RLO20746.1 3-dehydroquinate synthase [Pseudomonas protegens]
MKRSSLSRAFSLKGAAENYWLSLLLFSILVIASFLLFEQQIQQLLSHLGTFLPTDPVQRLSLALLLVTLLALDVLLPVPSSLVALLAVAALGAIGGYLVIFIGLCLGASLGYWLGAGYFRLLSNWLGLRTWQPGQLAYRLSTLSLVCLRGVPVLAETSVLAAGMQRYPLRQFLLVTTLANAGLALAYAAIGSLLVEQNALLATILASMVLPGLFLGTRSLFKSRLAQPRYDQVHSLEGRFQVSYHYPVLFTDHIFQADNPCLHQQLTRQNPGRTTVLVFVDEQLLLCSPQLPLQIDHYFSAHAADLHLQAAPIAVPAGELSKTPDVLQQLYAQMLEHGLDRHCYVLALGGGAVLDAVGYACATFHRGMRLIRIPSTVLAQNDAGIGVKNGINAFAQKNLLGAFYPATAVINDFQLLLSLSHRDQIAGLAEAVKVAVIKDAAFFQWMEQQAEALAGFEHNASRYAIHRCAELHLGHITGAGDPFERGNGRPLDYGHWAAHKLENLSQHRLRHGEAVAVGMALDALYANASGLLSDADCQRLLRLLDRLGFNLCPPELSLRDSQGRSPILVGLEEFRQHLGGQLSIPMLNRLGQSVDVHQIDMPLMEQALLRLAGFGGPDFAWGPGCAQ